MFVNWAIFQEIRVSRGFITPCYVGGMASKQADQSTFFSCTNILSNWEELGNASAGTVDIEVENQLQDFHLIEDFLLLTKVHDLGTGPHTGTILLQYQYLIQCSKIQCIKS